MIMAQNLGRKYGTVIKLSSPRKFHIFSIWILNLSLNSIRIGPELISWKKQNRILLVKVEKSSTYLFYFLDWVVAMVVVVGVGGLQLLMRMVISLKFDFLKQTNQRPGNTNLNFTRWAPLALLRREAVCTTLLPSRRRDEEGGCWCKCQC